MNFGQNIQSWFTAELGALFLVVIGAVAIFFLIKREFSKFVGFAFFAFIVSVFVFVPSNVADLGQNVWSRIFG